MTLRVERDPDDPKKLALELAEALQGASSRQQDSEAFAASARNRRTAAAELRITIDQVKRYRKNPPPGPPRRMDPMREYDLDAMQKELAEHLTKADEFRATADRNAHEANELRSKARALEAKIAQARKANGGS